MRQISSGRTPIADISERITLTFKSKAHKTLNRCEDPRETLDYFYERQLELLYRVCRGVAGVATSRKRVEPQAQKMSSEIDRYTVTAQHALESSRGDLARKVLTREAGLTTQLQDLQNQHAALQAEEGKLVRTNTWLRARVDAFRTHEETTKATYSAAEVQTRINRASTDVSEEMSDVGMAIQRAEDKTLQLQARASAVDELLASGTLEDPVDSVRDDLDRELDALASGFSVGNEFAAMKVQLSGGSDTTNSQISPTPASNFPMIEDIRTTNSSGGQA